IRKYVAIVSLEQRQSYEDEFNAGYGEYQTLRAQIDTITGTFRNLEEQRKLLTPGSTAYQVKKGNTVK
ncbi:ELL2 factor, partial [Formicarius rufipectus]|nr:ELL2 factor [Formicarius rufipectus]